MKGQIKVLLLRRKTFLGTREREYTGNWRGILENKISELYKK